MERKNRFNAKIRYNRELFKYHRKIFWTRAANEKLSNREMKKQNRGKIPQKRSARFEQIAKSEWMDGKMERNSRKKHKHWNRSSFWGWRFLVESLATTLPLSRFHLLISGLSLNGLAVGSLVIYSMTCLESHILKSLEPNPNRGEWSCATPTLQWNIKSLHLVNLKVIDGIG